MMKYVDVLVLADFSTTDGGRHIYARAGETVQLTEARAEQYIKTGLVKYPPKKQIKAILDTSKTPLKLETKEDKE